jgi:hypothetical protein
MPGNLYPGEFDPTVFAHRHIGPSAADTAAMLKAIGASSLDELIAQTVPQAIRPQAPLDAGAALSEVEAIERLRAIAANNTVLTSMIGQGYYGTILPPVIQRNILENPAWYTAYTPYQPEISQGRLEALLNFQTMIADLTGLDIANASLLDEATAAAEGMAMAQRVAKSKATAFFVDADCHPQTIAVVRTRAEPLGWQVIVGDPLTELDPAAVFGALMQYPGSSGEIRDFRPAIAALHAAGALAVLAADPLALTLLTPPGELGADIAGRRSRTAPDVPGYCSNPPNTSALSRSVRGSPTIRLQPSGSARVRSTASVCGCTSASTKNDFDFAGAARSASAMASAAAVPSSSSEALATSSPVRSQIMVWKLNSASSRPWLISG